MVMPANDNLDEKQLIFLISQPRSGSTLLQHILGSHPQVHTLAEPWLMLHFVYALREHGISAEYNARYAFLALKGFLSEIQKSEDDYLRAVRGAALKLYAAALEGTGKIFFLDKTPRYYLILPELCRMFPNARFVLLVRNPLAVLASLLHVVMRGRPQGFLSADRRHDIVSAPRLMVQSIKDLHGKAAVVHYERLVSDPERTIRDLCASLDIPYEASMLEYGDKVHLDSSFVDPKSIYKHATPVTDYVANWPQYLDTSGKVQMAQAYLRLLGRETVEGLGYSYGEIEAILNRLRPKPSWITLPWACLFETREYLPWWNRFRLAILAGLGHRGAKKIRRYYYRNKSHEVPR